MRINIVHANLIEVKTDAIVNSADSSLLGSRGVDEAIHRAAGPELLEECRALGDCETGCAKVTHAYGIRCKYIIHTVAPTWRDGFHGEWEKLASCYRASLELALEHGCESIAFPLLGAGSRGCPRDRALRIALDTIDDFLFRYDDCEMRVYLVIHNRSDYQLNPKLSQEVAAYLNRQCLASGPWTNPGPATDQNAGTRRKWSWWPFHRNQTHSAGSLRKKVPRQKEKQIQPPVFPSAGQEPPMPFQQLPEVFPSAAQSFPAPSTAYDYSPAPTPALDAMLGQLDEGFSQTLLRLIDKKGMSDAQCYKKANIDRKLFSKIRSNPTYCPSKPTVLAFAVALELTLDETNSLLRRAGFALSPARPFDVIVEFFISQGCFNVLTINETLFAYDQPLLGG